MNKWIQSSLGIALSILGLTYVFNRVDYADLLIIINNIDYFWLFFSVFLLMMSMIVRSIRWQYIIDSKYKIPLNDLFGSVMIGYFGNSILPFRIGEIARAFTLSKISAISSYEAFGTIILERVLDLSSLFIITLFVGYFFPFSSVFGNYFIFIISIILFFIFILLISKNIRLKLFTIFDRSMKKKLKGRSLIFIKLKDISNGFSILNQNKNNFRIFFLSFFLWFIYYIITLCGIQSIGIQLSLFQAGIVLIVTSFAIGVPSAPGAVGTYHAATVFIVHNIFLLTKEESLGLAILLHAIAFIPEVIVGAIYMIKYSITISDLRSNNQ